MQRREGMVANGGVLVAGKAGEFRNRCGLPGQHQAKNLGALGLGGGCLFFGRRLGIENDHIAKLADGAVAGVCHGLEQLLERNRLLEAVGADGSLELRGDHGISHAGLRVRHGEGVHDSEPGPGHLDAPGLEILWKYAGDGRPADHHAEHEEQGEEGRNYVTDIKVHRISWLQGE